MKAIEVDHPGGPEAMIWRDVPLDEPAHGEVTVRHTAVGVNFIDVYYRTGLYAWPSRSLIPGGEAAGVVEKVGTGVPDLKTGDRVAYVSRTGAYCEARNIDASRLVKLPSSISDEVAASAMLKGLTAHYLVNSCYKVKAGDHVLVHAAAGGVGLILGQWLRALGAIAIGTVGSREKAGIASAHGYAHTILYREEDFVSRVLEITGGKKCPVVYDSVGKDTWQGSLECLERRGMFVSFGQSSGMIEDFKLSDLARHGSLSANRPVLFDYVDEREELVARSAELFERLAAGEISMGHQHRLPLAQAADAHRMLEARRTTGSTVLMV